MSTLLLIDSMARGAIIGLLALWTWLLLRDHRSILAARLAIGMNLTIVCHVLTTFPLHDLPGSFGWLVELGSVSVPAMFWLFARAWFNDELRFGWLSWAAVPWSMALVAVVLASYPQRGALVDTVSVILRLSMFAFAIGGLWAAWRGREDDLVEARRRIRFMLVLGAGAFVLITNAVEVLVHRDVLGWQWRSFVEMGIAMLVLVICAAMFAVRQADLLGAAMRPPELPALAPEARGVIDAALAARLRDAMEHDRAYRDESLTIASLAARLGEQEYRLRRLINGSLGHRNFAQFLNSYRLAEVKAALGDPAQRDVPILTIALDAGFGSLGPFNRAFRDAEGMTPSTFRSKALVDSGIG